MVEIRVLSWRNETLAVMINQMKEPRFVTPAVFFQNKLCQVHMNTLSISTGCPKTKLPTLNKNCLEIFSLEIQFVLDI